MKLALIGQNIGHSLSPMIYKDLLKKDIDYKLLDYKSEMELPKLSELFEKYNLDGLSITSPYKKFYLDSALIEKKTIAINTIKKVNNNFIGFNTDIIAFQKQHQSFQNEFDDIEYIILGDGVMAEIINDFLIKENIMVNQYSRKMSKDFYTRKFYANDKSIKSIIVNCCSREYVFKNEIDPNIIFWDLNYNHKEHQQSLSNKVKLYLDGQKFLKDQAIAALAIWLNN